MRAHYEIASPEEMFDLGMTLSRELKAGDLILLYGGLGAGKTLLTKGVMGGLGYDIDEVTSPSFSLVNLYPVGSYKVYHIDLWRLDPAHDPAGAVGLEEILEQDDSITLVEWADRLGEHPFPNRIISIHISGDGDSPRQVVVGTSTRH